MRFWVVIGCVVALGCGGSVRHNESPGAGGSSTGSSGAMSSAGAGGMSGAVTDGGSSSGGNGGLQDGGSVPITPELRQELVNAACTGYEIVTHTIDAAIELVVGADVSMSLPAPGSDESRWTVTSNAVRQAFDVWPEYSDMGLIVYPNLGPDGATPSTSP